jgi:hypothetical protein
MRRFFLRAASALVVLGSTPAGCGSEEATRGSSAPEKTSRDSMLVQLPGWRNEGALLPIRRGHTVAPTANGTFHAWSLDLRESAQLRLSAEGVQTRLRLLERTTRRWRLVSSADADAAIDRRLPAGRYLVVVQSAAGISVPWRLSAACYGRGCPPVSPRS